jgi:hypothetical protein
LPLAIGQVQSFECACECLRDNYPVKMAILDHHRVENIQKLFAASLRTLLADRFEGGDRIGRAARREKTMGLPR